VFGALIAINPAAAALERHALDSWYGYQPRPIVASRV